MKETYYNAKQTSLKIAKKKPLEMFEIPDKYLRQLKDSLVGQLGYNTPIVFMNGVGAHSEDHSDYSTG